MEVTLDASAISAHLRLSGGVWDVHAFDSTASTNVLVKDAIAQGASEGYVAAALQQVAGYGRQGRTWVSPYGGLYFSLLLHPDVPVRQMPSIGPALSFAVREALADYAHDPDDVRIKWPNDVVCSAGKLCGMSCEYVDHACCIGIGINVFHPEQAAEVGGKNTPAYLADLMDPVAAQSLDQVELPLHPVVAGPGERPDADQVRLMERILVSALESIGTVYGLWKAHGFAALQERYESHAALIGTPVTITAIDDKVLAAGMVEGIDPDGCLVLRAADGTRTSISSGEIHLR